MTMSKVTIKKQDKLVSINGKPRADEKFYSYRVTRERMETTEWFIESNHELNSYKLEDACNWRESTGGNAEFPYGHVPDALVNVKETGGWIDVGYGTPNMETDEVTWRMKQLTTEYEDE